MLTAKLPSEGPFGAAAIVAGKPPGCGTGIITLAHLICCVDRIPNGAEAIFGETGHNATNDRASVE